MKHKHFPLLIIFLFIAVRISAQSTITLPQSINSAYSNRKNIQAGKKDVQIQQLITKALYKQYGPQASLEYNYNYNPILQSSIIPVGKFNPALPSNATEDIQFGTTWSQSAGITVTQPLYNAGIKKRIKESALQEKISSAGQAQSEYELAYDILEAYTNIYLQQQQVSSSIIDTTRTWLSYQLQQDKYTAGRLLKSDLNKAIINHNNTKQQLIDATIQMLENKIYLLYITGAPTDNSSDFSIDTSFLNSYSLLPVITNFSLDNIPVFQQINFQQQLSILRQETEKAKYLPIISLQGYLGANQYSNEFNPVKSNSWFGSSYIGLNVKLPLLMGEDKNKNIEQLQLESQKYLNQIQDKSAQYKQDASTALLEIERVKNNLATQGLNLNLYRESLKISQDRLKEGQITSFELNNQEQELQQLIATYENTKKQMWLYRLAYLKASGQLNKLWQ